MLAEALESLSLAPAEMLGLGREALIGSEKAAAQPGVNTAWGPWWLGWGVQAMLLKAKALAFSQGSQAL